VVKPKDESQWGRCKSVSGVFVILDIIFKTYLVCIRDDYMKDKGKM